MESVKKFNQWVNETYQSTTKGIENDNDEPAYSYGNIQDILGSKYGFVVSNDILQEFENNNTSYLNNLLLLSLF